MSTHLEQVRKQHLFDRRKVFGALWPRWSDVVHQLQWNARYKRWLAGYPDLYLDVRHCREAMYAHIVTMHVKKLPMLLMEFGVAGGDSLRALAQIDKHPDSRFYGFDTFTGLPETDPPYDKGVFAQADLPEFDDDRVILYPGLFQETLPGNWTLESMPAVSKTVIHIDCDLYSSTLYVLCQLERFLNAGDIIMLDEASCAHHEFRAVTDWCQAYRRTVRPVSGFRSAGRLEGLALVVE